MQLLWNQRTSCKQLFQETPEQQIVKPKTSQKTDFQSKKRKLGGKASFEEWKQKKEYEQYCQEVGTSDEDFVEN